MGNLPGATLKLTLWTNETLLQTETPLVPQTDATVVLVTVFKTVF